MEIEIEDTKDFNELTRLNETIQSWHHQNYPDDFKPYNFLETQKALEKLLKSPNSFALLAKSNSISIGYLIALVKRRPDSAFQYEKTVLYIDQIMVLDGYRNQGVGRLLLETAFGIAKENGASEIQLDHWTGNEFAKNFFLKNGFTYFNHRMKK